ncbi:unnamed protein product [Trifolium pratense]|uniref:Uncharacterized protein n=1 Tax=Trifolium pratense TaxID=57577 RepID=A0ACB0J9M1_TRIPR|nr:unnamed protein product [Trifolium pratense]
MVKRKNKKRRKEEIAEDWCFICKDGGELRVCDFKDCLKTYHADCAKEDASFLTNDSNWCCGSHFCFLCRRASKFMCMCCPIAVCGKCYYVAEFATVKRNKGFCRHCSKLAFLIEKNADADSDGEPIDMKDPDTYESYFLEYYESIKKKEGLNTQHVLIARDTIKNGKNKRDLDPCEIGEEEDDSGESDVSDFMGSDYDLDDTAGVQSRRKKACMKKIKSVKGSKAVKDKKTDFVGWGSRSLMDFLKNIGRDTTKEFSEHDVASIIIEYCHKNKLFDPEKKKRVICDANLWALLRRKSVNKNNIQNLLAPHFAENVEETDDAISGSEEMDNVEAINFPKQKNLNPTTKSCQSEVFEELPSEFAAIISSNVKLVYLKRSLIMELLKQPETFDGKVLGSFVRTKADPNDYLQKNSHLLLQVIGINRSNKDKLHQEILLRLSNVPKDVPISKISDDDFSEEECQDLYQRITNGLLKKPTILELEQKARTLHEHRMKHWISREITLLRNRIDLANEKGWRRELAQYMDQKQKLESPSEQSRLLSEIPKVIPEMVDTNLSPEDSFGKDKLDQNDIPELAIGEICNSVEQYSTHGGFAQCLDKRTTNLSPEDSSGKDKLDQNDFPELAIGETCNSVEQYSTHGGFAQCLDKRTDVVGPKTPVKIYNDTALPATAEQLSVHTASQNRDTSQKNLVQQYTSERRDDLKPALLKESNSDCQTVKEWPSVTVVVPVKATINDVIELSDSDAEDVNINVTSAGKKGVESPDTNIWHCSGIYGSGTRGPVSLSALKRWSEFQSDSASSQFKVWKTSESEREAMSLRDALKLFFP